MIAKNYLLRSFLSVSVIGTISASNNVLAQSNEQSATVLEEVVVTARKRAENLQSTPVAVNAFSADAIKQAGYESLSEILDSVPGFVATSENASEANLYLRGIGNSIEGAGVSPAVGIFVDDVYIPRSGGYTGEIFDLQRLEVVRGPQGTLYGKNVVGGAINFITKKPSDELSTQLEVTAGNFNNRVVRGLISGSLSDSLSGKIAVSYRDRGGYAFNTTTQEEAETIRAESIRGQLLFTPTDSLDILLSVDSTTTDGTPPWRHRFVNDPRNAFLDGTPPRRGPNNDSGLETSDSEGVALTITADLDFATLKSITAYRESDVDTSGNLSGNFLDFDLYANLRAQILAETPGLFNPGSFPDRERYDRIQQLLIDNRIPSGYFAPEKTEGFNSFSQEIRLSSNSDTALNWIVGAYFQQEGIDRSEVTEATFPFAIGFFSFATAPLTTDNNATGLNTDAYAVFAEIDYDISDTMSLTVGGRYTYEDKQFSIERSGQNAFGSLRDEDGNRVDGFTYSAGESWGAFTPSVQFSWQVTDDQYLYASYARGFKSGGWGAEAERNLADVQVTIDPEFADNIEFGARTEWLDNRLRLNATVFFTRYDDLQAAQLISDAVGLRTVVANAETAEAKGVELEFISAPLDGWTLSGTYAYLDTEITGDLNINARINARGNRLQNSPEHSLSINSNYVWELSSDDEVSVNLAYRWSDEFFVSNDNNPLGVIDAQYTFDASIKYNVSLDDLGELNISLWGKNLTDELNKKSGGIISPGYFLGTYFPPRTAGLTVRWFFN